MTEPSGENRVPLAQGERFLRVDDVMRMTGIPRSTIYLRTRRGEFPKVVPLPGGRTAWLETEVRAWMQGRLALRDPQPTAK